MPSKKSFWISATGLIFISFQAISQILDDTTKLLYSNKTVKYRYENQMITGHGYQTGDTSMREFNQQIDFLYQQNGWHQNLGVFGTAARPLFYTLPASIGLRNGMTAFDYLIPNRDQIPYFNTLSPYTEVFYMQGARQRSMLKTTLSQNVLPGLNLAAHYQRFTGLRILNVTQSDERLTDHHSAWISVNFQTKNKKYRAWAHYQHLNQLHYETGGALVPQQGRKDSLFISPNIMPVKLDANARNRDLRNNWYASQIWKPFGNFFLRTSNQRIRQVNTYGDPLPNLGFYGDSLYFQKQGNPKGKADSIWVKRTYQLWENGLYAGYQDSLYFLSVYVKRRDNFLRSNFFTRYNQVTEYLYGAQLQWTVGEKQFWAKGEWIGPEEFDLAGSLKWKGLLASGRILNFTPALIQREFFSKNLVYETNFQSSNATQFAVSYALPLKNLTLTPAFENQTVARGISFNQNFQPFQTDKIAVMQYLCLQMDGHWNRFHSTNKFIRVFQSGGRIAAMPSYVYHSCHEFALLKKRKGFYAALGFNLDWRFDWPSEDYNPLNGQWFLQTRTTIPPYFLFDAFTHIKIDRLRLYFKVHNTLQGLGGAGYYGAPWYPAQRRLFEFGLCWTFFD
jgi:hypothetical protein